MSLINDALRKAQNTVEKGPTKPIPLGPAGTHQSSGNKGSFLIVLAVVLVISLAGWGVALIVSQSNEDEPVVAAAIIQEPAAAPVVVLETLAPAVEASEVEAAPIEVAVEQAVTEPVVAPVSKSPEVVTQVVEPVTTEPEEIAREVSFASEVSNPNLTATSEPPIVASIPAVPPAQTPAAEAKPTPINILPSDEIVFFLKQMEITAVMGDGKNARIMMGGQIHQAGELIDLDLRIRLYGKKGTTLYFIDEQGKLYEKKI